MASRYKASRGTSGDEAGLFDRLLGRLFGDKGQIRATAKSPAVRLGRKYGYRHLPSISRYGAVKLRAGTPCCGAARSRHGRLELMSQAETLPLPGCTEATCRCRYEKYLDRRSEADRRETALIHQQIFLKGKDKRLSRGRRWND